MSDRSLPVAAILAAGLGLGFAGDQLLRDSSGPGLNLSLLFVGLGVAAWIVARRGGTPLSRESTAWIAVGVVCAAALLWRGSELLRFGTFVAACTAFALPAFAAGRSWARRAGVLDVLESLIGAGLHAGLGSTKLIQREHWQALGSESTRTATHRVVRSALVGVLLAGVPLFVFGALFVSADQIFAEMLGTFVHMDLEAFASRVALTAILSWLACGYLVGVSAGTRMEAVRRLRPRSFSLGVAEVGTALALVDLLFLAFVLVQFRYLFGGGAWVEITPELTYAAYARAGFFQLVAAVALAVPWLLLTHTLLAERGLRGRSVFAGFAGVQLVLLLIIVASAVQRMAAYQEAYGLTELRVIVTAILVWLTAIVLWFGATVLSGRRDRFMFGVLTSGFLLVGSLQVLDPTGRVVRHNLDRITELEEVDAAYLSTLGSDAAPILVDRLGELPTEAQCVVANSLIRKWGPARSSDWRSFHWSEDRARRTVKADLDGLRRVTEAEACG